MGILRLGKPNNKIINEIKRRHEQPVTVKKLKMISTNGTSYEFDYDQFEQPLTYVNYQKIVQEPWKNYADISDYNTVAMVLDEGNKLSSIGSSSFIGCTNLISVDCQSLTSIGNAAFTQCSNLSSFTCLCAQVINSSAFRYDYRLSSVDLPNVKNINSSAFQYCNSRLIQVNCPKLTSLMNYALDETNKLSTVIISSMSIDNLTQLGEIKAFGSKRKWPVSVYVPLSCIDDLLLNETWSGLVELGTIELVGV